MPVQVFAVMPEDELLEVSNSMQAGLTSFTPDDLPEDPLLEAAGSIQAGYVGM